MAEKQPEIPSLDIITQAGVAVWPKLNEPETYKGKTTYNTKLVVDPDEEGLVSKVEGNVLTAAETLRDEYAAAIRESLLEQAAEAKASKKGAKAKELTQKAESLVIVDVGKPQVDEDSGEETGDLILNAKTNALYKDKKTGKERERKLTIFNARGKELKNPPDIGGGSVLKLACTMRPYYMPAENKVGVTFYLNAVQIIELVSYGGARSAAGYGFGEEDGYDGEDEAEEAADSDADSDDPNF